MNSFLSNTLATHSTIFKLLSDVKKQHKFIKQNLQEELTEARNTNDGSLNEKDFKKITHYYGLAVPAILGEEICALRGYKMSEKERLALTYQGAMTGLGDDFFDKQGTSSETVKAFIETPENFQGNTTSEKLFLSFYKKALLYANDPVLVRQYLRKVFVAQLDSKKQAMPGLRRNEILNITLDKGGASVLFYRASMSNAFNLREEEALYKIGGLMQFGNDIFDTYDDCLDKINTLTTTTKKINEVREIFQLTLDESFKSVYKAGYPKKNTKKFLRLVSMSLCSRCFVCLDQLEENEKLTNNIFTPEKYSRKQLVCDMDKGTNKWKTIRYFIRNGKSH